ncbi:ATP-binding protein [Nostocoides australiense]
MLIPSPFTPGDLPRVLVGRAAERRRLADLLARVTAYGELAGPPVVLHAPRGLGKTTLLRDTEDRARELGFVTAWVACAKGSPMLTELAASVRRALIDAEVLDDRSTKRVLDTISVEFAIFGVGFSTEFARGAAPEVPTGAISSLERMLHEAAAAIRARGGAGLLVLIDELHAAPYAEVGVLLNAMQNLAGRRAENPLALMTAGLPSTPEMIMRAATFGERSEFIGIDRFDDADSRRVLEEPAQEEGVGWAADAISAGLDIADGNPYLLQLVGDSTWQAAAPRTGDTIELDDLHAGEDRMRGQLAAMCRARWDSASDLEQAFLGAMADYGEEIVPREHIATTMGRESRAISVPRARLIDRGVIEAAGRGRLRFTLPGMGAWIREHQRG